jgi:hypothetical protein
VNLLRGGEFHSAVERFSEKDAKNAKNGNRTGRTIDERILYRKKKGEIKNGNTNI